MNIVIWLQSPNFQLLEMSLRVLETYYDKFMRQEKLFAKPAADYIQNTLEEFAKRLREMQ